MMWERFDERAEMEMKLAKSAAELLATWPMLQKVPLVNIEPHAVLGQALLGQSAVMLAYVDNHLEGCMYFTLQDKTVQVVALYLPGLLAEFMPKFVDWAKGLGFERMTAVSTYEPEKYKRLFGMDVVYTTYEREL